MYLGEVPEGRTRDDLAMIIEEVLRQRIQGTKNEKGVWITPAFPKLVYALEEDNIREDSKYWYLTKLSAQCSAKRLVPDYVSEKIMKQTKVDDNGVGHCFPPMGCLQYHEEIELDSGIFEIGEVVESINTLLKNRKTIEEFMKSGNKEVLL